MIKAETGSKTDNRVEGAEWKINITTFQTHDTSPVQIRGVSPC